jgi:predicted ATPase/class 3 adenylate cyclase
VEIFTFLFTDIEGSTAMLRRLGAAAYAQVLADHHDVIRSGLAAHEGEEVDTQGDAFFAVFSSPADCVAAAVEMQRAIGGHAWPATEQVRVRMGIHTGAAAKTETGLVGLDVHRAARLAAVAYGGQILVSEATAVLVRDTLPPGAVLRDLGPHRLKDLGRPERIYQLDAAGLAADFPPLRTLGHPALPNNLPVQPATFIGRAAELAEVRDLIASSRLVTLTGAGGTGKTRLGLQVAAGLLDGTGCGVWLVELAAVSSADAVPSAISAALGLAGAPGRRVRPALAGLTQLLEALAFQDVLIILDNCEHLIDACAKTADAILRSCPGVYLLATSREPLGIGGETIYRVPSLSLPGADDADSPGSGDAVALFIERAKEQGVDLPVDEQTIPLLVSICRRLDGLPLAIELAAARLRSISLNDLRSRLDHRFRLLTGGSRAALERQQTLRATVDWSYSLLNAPEQSLLRRLSVFAESFDLAAAEAVGAGPLDVTDVLGSLVNKSLVLAEPAGGALRYRLLETIRQFAAERLVEAGEDEALAAAAEHCAYFLRVAEAAAPHLTGPDQGRWFARLDADQANLRRAAEHAAGAPAGAALVLRFGVALRRYWLARSRNDEAFGLLAPVLDRREARPNPENPEDPEDPAVPEAAKDLSLFGTALVTVTALAPFTAVAPGRPYGDQAVRLGRRLGDDRLLIDALSMLAAAYFIAGQPERGLPAGLEAVERARRFGDDVLLGQALMGCMLCSDVSESARPGPLLAEAIACTERSGDHLMHSYVRNNAGVQALRAGDIPAARAHLEQGAHAAQVIGDENNYVWLNLGWVRREEHDLDGAQYVFEEGLRRSRRKGEQANLAYASVGLACLAADQGDWRRAATLHGVAQAFLDRTGEPWQDLEARYRDQSLAQVRAHLGDEQFDRAYAQGRTLSVDEAFQCAGAFDGVPVP